MTSKPADPRFLRDKLSPKNRGQALGGVAGGIEDLADQHYPAVRRFFIWQSRVPVLADDLTQQTFLEAIKSIGQLKDDLAGKAWLFGIAQHVWLMHLRKNRLRGFVSLEWLMRDGADAPALRRWTDDAKHYAEQELIAQALADMPPKLRDALILRRQCGLSDPEIARVLGISSAAAQKRTYRAEAQFREHYVHLNAYVLEKGAPS